MLDIFPLSPLPLHPPSSPSPSLFPLPLHPPSSPSPSLFPLPLHPPSSLFPLPLPSSALRPSPRRTHQRKRSPIRRPLMHVHRLQHRFAQRLGAIIRVIQFLVEALHQELS